MVPVTDIITFTPAAEQHILNIIEKRGSGVGFRLSIKKTGCSGYMYQPSIIDTESEGDIKIVTAQHLCVFIDAAVLPLIQGTAVDYVKKSLGQQQLEFNNPRAVGACGCGESFHFEGDA